jgi:hypothetical protein
MTEFNVSEFVAAREKQGSELFRLMEMLPFRGHWGCEIRPFREVSTSDVLIWHVDDPVRMAAEASEDMWRGDHLMLKFLKRLSALPRGEIAPLVEVVLTTVQTATEDKPIPVLELRYLEGGLRRARTNSSGNSRLVDLPMLDWIDPVNLVELHDHVYEDEPVIGQTPLVANGIEYRLGALQTVNGFAGAAQMIKMNKSVVLNCDNVQDLKPKYQKLGMRLLVSARIEV